MSSRDAGRAAAYAREQGIPAFHAGHAGLIADPAVEAVYISAPNALHVEWTMAAIAAGKHVLCEKPLTRSAAAARATVDAADAAGVVLAEAFMYRHHPQIRRLAEQVHGGEVGALRSMRSAFGFTADRPDDILLRSELDGGGLLDVGCYCVSAFRLLAGEPQHVRAEAEVGPTGVDLRFLGRMEFAGGVTGEFECGIAMPETSLLEVDRRRRDAAAGRSVARARAGRRPVRAAARGLRRGGSRRAVRRWLPVRRSCARPRPWRR